MTLGELNLAAEVRGEQEFETMQKLAWHAANVMNVHTKKRVKVSDLIKDPKKRVFRSRAEIVHHMRKVKEREKRNNNG